MTEQFLLEWLSKEDSAALGECSGKTLDALIAKGFAEIGPTPAGRDPLYARVTLTDAGRASLST